MVQRFRIVATSRGDEMLMPCWSGKDLSYSLRVRQKEQHPAGTAVGGKADFTFDAETFPSDPPTERTPLGRNRRGQVSEWSPRNYHHGIRVGPIAGFSLKNKPVRAHRRHMFLPEVGALYGGIKRATVELQVPSHRHEDTNGLNGLSAGGYGRQCMWKSWNLFLPLFA